jgi:hypothetical protein
MDGKKMAAPATSATAAVRATVCRLFMLSSFQICLKRRTRDDLFTPIVASALPSVQSRRCCMPRGDKSKYTDKQKRQAEHIEEGYEERGVSKDEAERRAWATVNKVHGGGEK